MRTIDDIIKDLRARGAGGEDVRQQIISHQAIARLRAELTTLDHTADPDRARGLAQQIGTHRAMVEEDADHGEEDADQPVDQDDNPARAKRSRSGPPR